MSPSFKLIRKKLYISLGLLTVIFLYAGSFVFSYSRILKSNNPLLITDVARLIPLKVHRVDTLDTIEDLNFVRNIYKKVYHQGKLFELSEVINLINKENLLPNL